MNLPTHIAIVPDGNRRWAKQQGLPTFMGHQKGAEAAEKLLEDALQRQIKYFTLWGCSIDNVTKRDPVEVKFLFEIFERYFKKLLESKTTHEHQVRLRVLGAWRDYFPPSLQEVIADMMEKTKEHAEHHLTFLMAYSGFDEMTKAIQTMAAGSTGTITPQVIKEHLFTADLPAVDLFIRTGGEPHWSSGFMMWDIADALLYFTEKMWPDFTPSEFQKALEFYEGTQRRRGV